MFEPGDDFPAVVDGLEGVTLERADGSASSPISAALRLAERTRPAAPTEGVYRSVRVVWQLPASELAEAPRLGDAVVDASGRRWTILAVEGTAGGTRWRCQTEHRGLEPARHDTLDIEQPMYTKTESGALVTTWQVVATGVPARIQPLAESPHTEPGRQWSATRVAVYLAQGAPVDARCRLRDAQGRLYTILQIRNASRNDALLEIDALWR